MRYFIIIILITVFERDTDGNIIPGGPTDGADTKATKALEGFSEIYCKKHPNCSIVERINERSYGCGFPDVRHNVPENVKRTGRRQKRWVIDWITSFKNRRDSWYRDPVYWFCACNPTAFGFSTENELHAAIEQAFKVNIS